MRALPVSSLRALVGATLLVVAALLPTVLMSASPVAAQIESLDEVEREDPPGLGSIIGSPEAGPKPEDAGDRGGWAQLVLAVALFGGVGFILTRVFRAASAGDRAP